MRRVKFNWKAAIIADSSRLARCEIYKKRKGSLFGGKSESIRGGEVKLPELPSSRENGLMSKKELLTQKSTGDDLCCMEDNYEVQVR